MGVTTWIIMIHVRLYRYMITCAFYHVNYIKTPKYIHVYSVLWKNKLNIGHSYKLKQPNNPPNITWFSTPIELTHEQVSSVWFLYHNTNIACYSTFTRVTVLDYWFLTQCLQPREDLDHMLEVLFEYKGMLSTYPDVLKLHEVCLL